MRIFFGFAPDGLIAKAQSNFRVLGGLRARRVERNPISDRLHIAGRIYYETHLLPLLTMQGFVNEVALGFSDRCRRRLPTLVNLTERRDAAGVRFTFD